MDQMRDADYKKVLTEVIKKQMIILGSDITLAKARNVHGLTIANDGTVTEIQGHPQELIQSLIDQFVQLSGLIVKKTMEPLLSMYPDGASEIISEASKTQSQIPTAPSVATEPQQNSPLTNQAKDTQNVNAQLKT